MRLVFCCLGSVAVGYALVGARVFQPQLTSFQFVASGALAGLAVAVATVAGPRWLVAGPPGVIAPPADAPPSCRR